MSNDTHWRRWVGGPEEYGGRAHYEVGTRGDASILSCGRIRDRHEARRFIGQGPREQDACPECWAIEGQREPLGASAPNWQRGVATLALLAIAFWVGRVTGR